MKNCFLYCRIKVLLILAAILLLTPPYAKADTVTWWGSLGDWNDLAHWSTGWIPMPVDDVVVSSTGDVAVNTSNIISSLTLTPDLGDAPLVLHPSGVIKIVPPCLYDAQTGLCWGYPLVYTEMTYSNAYNWAQARGQRLPTFQEFMDFLTQSNYDITACWNKGDCWIAGSQYDFGPDLVARGYYIHGASVFWTTTPHPKYGDSNWAIWINTGYAASYQSTGTGTLNLWMVRDVLP